MPSPLTTPQQRRIRVSLLEADPRLEQVFAVVPLREIQPSGNLPVRLMHAIVSQQLSVRVADVIWGRIEQACGGTVSTDAVGALSQEALRRCGLSRQKLAYLYHVVAYAGEHDLSVKALRHIPDQDLITQLSRIKGVGRWTVEMLLLFELNRPDVFPAQDLGIQNAMRRLYRMRSQGKAFYRRLDYYSNRWRPHRSHVVHCLWRWLEE